MRPEFSEIVSGWMLVDDFDELTDRIERSGKWAEANGPLEADATDPRDVLNWDLERKP